jgi:hypothetical protein
MSPPSFQTEKSNDILESDSKVGFTRYSEVINGRFAMVGFVALLTIGIAFKHL